MGKCDKMFSMERFSDWLLKELAIRKLNQSQLATVAGLGSGTISNIMNGNRKVGQNTLIKIAEALKLPPETVFEAAHIYKPTYTKDDEKDPTLMEWIKIYKDASPDQREIMIENARFFSNRGTQKR
jgi:transcriptional regulator with XRE-family HTH domain